MMKQKKEKQQNPHEKLKNLIENDEFTTKSHKFFFFLLGVPELKRPVVLGVAFSGGELQQIPI